MFYLFTCRYKGEDIMRKLIQKTVDTYKGLEINESKISYLILKPNAAKHYQQIIQEIEANQFQILGQYAIMDYESINMALHIEQPKSLKYIMPISRMYNDFYGNYAILIVIAKKNITYEHFCIQVASLKRYLRDKMKLSYVSFAFNTAELGEENERQRLIILSKDGTELAKDEFNKEGTFMVFYVNEIHSPDDSVANTIKEMKLLLSLDSFNENLKIPKSIVENMKRYGTFELLKDLL